MISYLGEKIEQSKRPKNFKRDENSMRTVTTLAEGMFEILYTSCTNLVKLMGCPGHPDFALNYYRKKY